MAWATLILGDALDALIDNRGKNPPFAEDGIPVVSGMCVRGGALDLSVARRVSIDIWRRWMPIATQRHDVVLTSEAPLGRVALVPNDEPLTLGQRVFGMRGRVGVLDSRYLYYAFQTEAAQSELLARATGTTVIGIRQPALRNVHITAPPYTEQRAIAEVLGALDDKIAANTGLLAAADELSRVTFESMLGAAEPQPLSSLARFVNGRAFTKGASGAGRVVIRIAELNSGIGGSTVFSDIDVPDEHLVRPGDILFAWSGSLTLHRWYRAEAIVNQHIFKVIPNAGVPHWLIYELIRAKLTDFKAIAANKATTMGHIQRRHLDETVPVPPEAVIVAHDGAMTALWQRALSAEQENLTLAATRDALLPELMSGRLRVKDAERIVSDRGRA